ncbi:MAG: response regulator [Actinomycetota bacterium]|nr:response regulator [Actinomycetota bacterium]
MSACEKASALVVDDDRLLLRLVELNLGKAGIEVLLADSGREALRIAREERPDVILLDLMMPVMDGFQVMQELKSARETRDIPVIMLTAKSGRDDRRRCEELGAVAYVTKPFSLEELRSTVRSILEYARGSRER